MTWTIGISKPLARSLAYRVDRPSRGHHGGSIGFVVLIALALIAAAGGLLYVGKAGAEPYLTALLAVLAAVGVFLLFALATGFLRIAGREAAAPMIKAVVDGSVVVPEVLKPYMGGIARIEKPA